LIPEEFASLATKPAFQTIFLFRDDLLFASCNFLTQWTGNKYARTALRQQKQGDQIGRSLTLGSVLKMTEVAKKNFGLPVFHGTSYICINLDKKSFFNILGDILGNFFKDSSGHPDLQEQKFVSRVDCTFARMDTLKLEIPTI
jgi:hypothetical protein